MKRDLYIDYAKGMATLCIIFIHTAFWSGQLYLPYEVRALSLLFDVPVFFLLSGLTSSGNVDKTFMRLLKLQITYMLFTGLIFVLDGVYKEILLAMEGKQGALEHFRLFGEKYMPQNLNHIWNWERLGNWFVHQYSNCDLFPVVMGSFWYLKTYFCVSIFGVLALRFFPNHIKWLIGLCILLSLYFSLVPKAYPSGQVGYVAYYLGVFLLANQWRNGWSRNQVMGFVTGMVVAYLAMFGYYGADVFYKINKLKFPPQLPYIVWSFFSLTLVMVLYKRISPAKENLLSYIGQNAIFFYFAQGISSSLVYYLVDAFKENLAWPVLMILVFIVNIILAIGVARVLKAYDAWGWKQLEKLKKLSAV